MALAVPEPAATPAGRGLWKGRPAVLVGLVLLGIGPGMPSRPCRQVP